MQEKAKELKRIKQLKANGDIDQAENKIVEQILKGVNVLMVHSKADLALGGKESELKRLLEEEMNMLFKLTHHNVFRIQIQVFKLLFQFAKVSQGIAKQEVHLEKPEGEISNFSDRFYRTLYELLLKVHMGKATSLDEYFGLVFKAMKADENVPRVIAFIKRLLQMSYLNESNFTAASLLILSELFKHRRDLKLALYSLDFNSPQVKDKTTGVKLDQAGSDDDEEERFVDVDKLADQAKVEVK